MINLTRITESDCKQPYDVKVLRLCVHILCAE